MATAANYGVTFGYRAQDGYWYGPNGRVGKYHRGNDRPTPPGVPVIIGNVTIGHTGATGIVSGPHLHTQAMLPGTNTDVDPSPYEFKYGQVVDCGWHNQFGNFVKVRTSGVDIIYAHLSQINVSTGQVIGGNEVANRDQVNAIYKAVLFRDGDEGGLNNYTGKDANAIIADMLNSQERRNLEARFGGLQGQVSERDGLINQLNNKLNELQQLEAQEDIVEAEKTERIGKLQVELDTLNGRIKDTENRPAPEPKPATIPAKKAGNHLVSKLILALLNRRKK